MDAAIAAAYDQAQAAMEQALDCFRAGTIDAEDFGAVLAHVEAASIAYEEAAYIEGPSA